MHFVDLDVYIVRMYVIAMHIVAIKGDMWKMFVHFDNIVKQ